MAIIVRHSADPALLAAVASSLGAGRAASRGGISLAGARAIPAIQGARKKQVKKSATLKGFQGPNVNDRDLQRKRKQQADAEQQQIIDALADQQVRQGLADRQAQEQLAELGQDAPVGTAVLQDMAQRMSQADMAEAFGDPGLAPQNQASPLETQLGFAEDRIGSLQGTREHSKLIALHNQIADPNSDLTESDRVKAMRQLESHIAMAERNKRMRGDQASQKETQETMERLSSGIADFESDIAGNVEDMDGDMIETNLETLEQMRQEVAESGLDFTAQRQFNTSLKKLRDAFHKEQKRRSDLETQQAEQAEQAAADRAKADRDRTTRQNKVRAQARTRAEKIAGDLAKRSFASGEGETDAASPEQIKKATEAVVEEASLAVAGDIARLWSKFNISEAEGAILAGSIYGRDDIKETAGQVLQKMIQNGATRDDVIDLTNWVLDNFQ